jgi:glutathione peroxidase
VNVYDVRLSSLDGQPLDPQLFWGKTTVVVNVASRCGFTPQYTGLQALYERYHDDGLQVLGVPCGQFAGQELGSEEEIGEFCSTTYGVTFPLTEKLEVNGRHRHALYQALIGDSGPDVQWNFEKFLVSPHGRVVGRFGSSTAPDSEALVDAIEAHLPRAVGSTWASTLAGDVTPGDRVLVPSGDALSVTRIQRRFLDRDDLVCLIEDTDARWYAKPVKTDVAVQVLR